MDRLDLTRATLQLLFIGALVAGCFWILRPFLIALIWAATIVVSSWPVYQRVLASFGGSRGPAVAVMTLAMMLVLVAPLYLAITTIVENADRIAEWSRTVATLAVAPPPVWLEAIPLVGSKVAARWQELASESPEELSARFLPYARTRVRWRPGSPARWAASG